LPANIKVAPNSPIARAHVITAPARIPFAARGNVTVMKTLSLEGFNNLALSINLLSTVWNALLADRTTNGDATKN
jgi:hypothetical protein